MAFNFELCDRRVKREMKWLISMVVAFIVLVIHWVMSWVALKTGLNFYFVLFVGWALITMAVDSYD